MNTEKPALPEAVERLLEYAKTQGDDRTGLAEWPLRVPPGIAAQHADGLPLSPTPQTRFGVYHHPEDAGEFFNLAQDPRFAKERAALQARLNATLPPSAFRPTK